MTSYDCRSRIIESSESPSAKQTLMFSLFENVKHN